MDEEYMKKMMTAIILVVFLVLSFFLVKPILISIISGIMLAFIFGPVYEYLYKKTRSRNLSAGAICVFVILILLLPIWFLTPTIIDQSFKVFQASQQIDFTAPLQKFFPSIFDSEEFATEIGSMLRSFVTNLTNSLTNSLGDIILNFPTLFLQSLVAFFTLFFTLRDRDLFMAYLRSFSPFSKEVEKKFFESSKGITYSVLYGQIIVGIVQGLLVSIGFLIFGVPNALFLSLLACLAGIFPIIGTTIVWVPVVIYLFIEGSAFSAFGIVFFGLLSNIADNFLRPIIVSMKSKMHTSLVMIGMIGGLFLFGIIGFILGPLILAYLFILLEIYRNKKIPGIFIQDVSNVR